MSEAVQPSADQVAEYEEKVQTFEDDELAGAQRMGRRGWATAVGVGALLAWSEFRNWRLGEALTRSVTERPITSAVVAADTGAAYLVRDQIGPPVEVEKVLVKHMAWQLVSLRERWNRHDDQLNFDTANLLLSDDEQRNFAWWWTSDPEGPRKTLAPEGWAEVQHIGDPEVIQSPASAVPDIVEHRIRRFVMRPGERPKAEVFRIRIYFGWQKGRIRDDVRLPNPYGFVCTNYARLKETA